MDWTLTPQLASARVERDYDARIRKIVERMLGDGDMLSSPEDMAALAGLSRAQFFRLFKKSTGLPPTLFLSMLKMEASLQKVAQRDISLQDIAFDLGFDTAGNFTRFFVGMQGFAPSKYRKLLEVV
ncbi:helix-turn-helix domain-containing protein [Variovorax paradoxus]|uniref:helix-turn-helix domain-containing protein n=1 Tax=Variovorax paradoxus TaxID=34073 RepID=UPI001F3F0B55|nr:AraC family transcriptional regulator [Variovorax paradoxus]UKI08717.1 AraC family transcriptional regulator [Variovorax paradoxus]